MSIIRLLCMVDDQLGHVNQRSSAHLYPSEIVTLGLLFSLKGGGFRAFYRWLNANDRALFPALSERHDMAPEARACRDAMHEDHRLTCPLLLPTHRDSVNLHRVRLHHRLP